MADPVFKHNNKWYFFDETWSECYGPIASEWMARACCRKYADTLEGGEINYAYPGANWCSEFADLPSSD